MSISVNSIGELDNIREINNAKIRSIHISSNHDELFASDKYLNRLKKLTNLNNLKITSLYLDDDNNLDIVKILESLINTDLFIIIEVGFNNGFIIDCVSSKAQRIANEKNMTALSLEVSLFTNNIINYDYLPNNVSTLILRCDLVDACVKMDNIPSSISTLVIESSVNNNSNMEIKLPFGTELHQTYSSIETINYIYSLYPK